MVVCVFQFTNYYWSGQGKKSLILLLSFVLVLQSNYCTKLFIIWHVISTIHTQIHAHTYPQTNSMEWIQVHTSTPQKISRSDTMYLRREREGPRLWVSGWRCTVRMLGKMSVIKMLPHVKLFRWAPTTLNGVEPTATNWVSQKCYEKNFLRDRFLLLFLLLKTLFLYIETQWQVCRNLNWGILLSLTFHYIKILKLNFMCCYVFSAGAHEGDIKLWDTRKPNNCLATSTPHMSRYIAIGNWFNGRKEKTNFVAVCQGIVSIPRHLTFPRLMEVKLSQAVCRSVSPFVIIS